MESEDIPKIPRALIKKVNKIDIGIFCSKVCKKRMIFSGFEVTVDLNIRLKNNS